MGLSDAEKERRKNDEHVKYIAGHVCNKDGDKPYVFISYKSDDWEIVLHDIVYRLVKEKGLNVYFDGDFGSYNPHWTTQFPENMSDPKCKGVLIFLNDNYIKSYATLLELMYSQCYCQDPETLDFVKKKVVPVNLTSALSVISSEDDTGLGKTSYFDGKKMFQNPKAMAEKELFDKAFQRGCKIDIFDKAEAAYKKKDLSKKLCSVMVSELLSNIDYNDNFYLQKNSSLEDIVNSIKSVCGSEVFNIPADDYCSVELENNGISQKLSVKVGDKISEPNIAPIEGKCFLGWFYSVNGEEKKWCFESDIVHRNMTLYAKFEEISNNLWEYRTKGVVSYLEWDGESKNCIVKKGSKVAAEANGFAKLLSAKNMKDNLLQKGILVNDEFIEDYPCDKISTMINVITGGAVSMPKAMKDGVLCRCSEIGVLPNDVFEYQLWSVIHTAGKLSDMMHDVFDLVAEKYPEKMMEIAYNESISAVALKQDVDNGNLPENKKDYFKVKKEHEVGGNIYYVSTRYNRENGIGQLEKILSFCEGSADAFKILSAPDKVVHSSNRKKGLNELL